jgi:ACR3 family arsenite transporter
MVLIWNNLVRTVLQSHCPSGSHETKPPFTNQAGGNGDYCAILVAVNSFLQIVLFAPMSLLFLCIFDPHSPAGVAISYSTVATSVGVFLGIPLGAAIATRLALLRLLGSRDRYATHFLRFAAP